MSTYNDTDRVYLGASWPASPNAVETIMTMDEDNGRSEWRWLRLANGDLMLGVFPQADGADGYFATEVQREEDWHTAADANGDMQEYTEEIGTVVLPK